MSQYQPDYSVIDKVSPERLEIEAKAWQRVNPEKQHLSVEEVSKEYFFVMWLEDILEPYCPSGLVDEAEPF
jgi:hypothetical protein